MGSPHAAPVGARGGERIPSLRPARARLITALGGLAALTGAAAYAAGQGGRLWPLVVLLGGLGVAILLTAIVLRSAVVVPWALALVAAAYLVERDGHHVVDGGAALVGALLLLAAELASWSIEHDARIHADRGLVLRRLTVTGGLVLGALLVDVLLLGAAGMSASTGIVLAILGVAAAVGAVAMVLRLVRE